jgi:hypothetical protein
MVRLVFLHAMLLFPLHVAFPSFYACFFLAAYCARSKIRYSFPKIGISQNKYFLQKNRPTPKIDFLLTIGLRPTGLQH